MQTYKRGNTYCALYLSMEQEQSFDLPGIKWDCPCPGSRFDTNGEVLHVPTSTSLPILLL